MSVLQRARWPIIICLARLISMIFSPHWKVEASNYCVGQDDPSNCLIWVQAECRLSNACPSGTSCDGQGCCEGGPYPFYPYYPEYWSCCQQISIANPGTLSSLSATTCVGGSVSMPGISGTVVSNGFECAIMTYDCPSHPSITITSECCYSMTNWWVASPSDAPMPPAVYTSPGTYTYTAKVKALVDDCYWDDDYLPLCPDSAEATVGTFEVVVFDHCQHGCPPSSGKACCGEIEYDPSTNSCCVYFDTSGQVHSNIYDLATQCCTEDGIHAHNDYWNCNTIDVVLSEHVAIINSIHANFPLGAGNITFTCSGDTVPKTECDCCAAPGVIEKGHWDNGGSLTCSGSETLGLAERSIEKSIEPLPGVTLSVSASIALEADVTESVSVVGHFYNRNGECGDGCRDLTIPGSVTIEFSGGSSAEGCIKLEDEEEKCTGVGLTLTFHDAGLNGQYKINNCDGNSGQYCLSAASFEWSIEVFGFSVGGTYDLWDEHCFEP